MAAPPPPLSHPSDVVGRVLLVVPNANGFQVLGETLGILHLVFGQPHCGAIPAVEICAALDTCWLFQSSPNLEENSDVKLGLKIPRILQYGMILLLKVNAISSSQVQVF